MNGGGCQDQVTSSRKAAGLPLTYLVVACSVSSVLCSLHLHLHPSCRGTSIHQRHTAGTNHLSTRHIACFIHSDHFYYSILPRPSYKCATPPAKGDAETAPLRMPPSLCWNYDPWSINNPTSEQHSIHADFNVITRGRLVNLEVFFEDGELKAMSISKFPAIGTDHEM